MCWNVEVSFMTGFVTYLICFYIYLRNHGYDRWLGLFMFVVGTMQWIEGLIWYNLDSPINYYLTVYAIAVALPLQFITSLYCASLYGKINKYLIPIYQLASVLCFAFEVYYNHSSTVIDGELAWGDQTHTMLGTWFLVVLILPFVYMKDRLLAFLTVAMTAGTFVISMNKYPYTWTSNWCLYGNGVSVLALLYPALRGITTPY